MSNLRGHFCSCMCDVRVRKNSWPAEPMKVYYLAVGQLKHSWRYSSCWPLQADWSFITAGLLLADEGVATAAAYQPFGAYGLASMWEQLNRMMAQWRSAGTRDTLRQDKACCLCLFPLQCFWKTAAPALVLCLKPTRQQGSTWASEFRRGEHIMRSLTQLGKRSSIRKKKEKRNNPGGSTLLLRCRNGTSPLLFQLRKSSCCSQQHNQCGANTKSYLYGGSFCTWAQISGLSCLVASFPSKKGDIR